MKIKQLIYFSMVAAIVNFSSCSNDESKPKTLPIVVTGTSITTTTNSATVSGEITSDGNASITEAGFVYSSNVSVPTTADNKAVVEDIDDFMIEITGLNSGTEYFVRAYATNSKGTSYGDVETFETGNLAPVITNLTITGTLEVAKTLTATYTYTDAEGDPEEGTAFQWYVADTGTGTGETAIDGATSKTLIIEEEQNGKFLRVSVMPKAAGGTTNGIEVKSSFTTAIGSETVTFIYNNVNVTYGTITTSTGRKWLDRNLGASRVAQSLTDYEAYGDMFQWGRARDGHQLVTRSGGGNSQATAVAGITSTTSDDDTPETSDFIAEPVNRDWRTTPNSLLWQGVNGVNNPCPAGWRIPTVEEWDAEEISSADDALNRLKMTFTGRRGSADGNFAVSSEIGIYWTASVNESNGRSWYSSISSDGYSAYHNPRGTGSACRCIKD